MKKAHNIIIPCTCHVMNFKFTCYIDPTRGVSVGRENSNVSTWYYFLFISHSSHTTILCLYL